MLIILITYLYILISDTGNTVQIELPDIEYRINMLIVVGVLILGLALLISLKIYQIEKMTGDENNNK